MTETVPGYAGKIFRIDLTNERIWTEELTPEVCRKYIGGTGLGAKILYEEVPPEVSWDHPENRLIMATGPLAGTPIWGTGTLSVVTRGAMTNGGTSTQANGFFGASLKYSGYDAIVLQGQSKRWVYVYINDDTVELRDASHLLGKDTWQMQDALYEENGLTGHQLSVYGIGPAGEKLVRFAIILGDYGHAASKNGTGAVMGSKKVKCVAIVRGTHPIQVHDPAGLYAAADEISWDLKNDPSTSGLYNFGTLGGVAGLVPMGGAPIKNFTTNIYPDAEKLSLYEAPNIRASMEHRGHQCNGCGMRHCHIAVMAEGAHKGQLVDEPEYEGLAGCGSQLGMLNPADAVWLNTQVDKAGFDVNEWGWVCGWVIECLEKGYLTVEQVGVDVKWGDAEGVNKLIQMVANREGFGDLMAEGVKRAAEKIGGEAYNCAIFIHKGVSPRGHDHRARWEEMLDATTSSIATIETGGLIRPTEFGLPARRDPFDPEEVARTVGLGMGRRHFEDSLGTCMFTTRTYLEYIARALSTVTGWDYNKEEAMHFGKRVAAIFRAFNLRCGIGMEGERPSPRYGSVPIDGPAKGMNVMEHWDFMRKTWYETVGYDFETGRPTIETLKKLDLEDLIPDVWGVEAVAQTK